MERADREFLGAGGIFSTTGDLARFMRALGEHRLLEPGLRDLMLTAVDVENGVAGR